MKRIVVVLLSILLLSQSVCVFAASEDRMGKSDASAITVIKDLGLLTLSEYKSEATVRRQDLAEIVASSLLNGTVSKTTSIFTDVGKDDEKAVYIMAAYNLGIMKGYFDGSFQPYRIVTYNEAAKTLVTMLGYGGYAELKGGWPKGYQAVATELKLNRGVDVRYDDPITLGHLCMMVQRALETDMMDYDTVTTDELRYTIVEGRTILDQYMGISIVEDKMTANHITVLRGTEKTEKGKVLIGGKLYRSAAPGLADQLGAELKCYVKEMEGIDTVVAYERRKNTGTELLLHDENIVSVEADKLIYTDETEKERSIKLDKKAELIYNGEKIYSWTSENIPTVNSEIRFMDSDGDGSFDLIFANRFVNYVVRSYVENTQTIYLDTARNTTQSLILDADKGQSYNLCEADGTEISPSQLAQGDVLSVAAGASGHCYIIYRSTKSVTGILKSLDENTVKLDDKEYTLDGDWGTSVKERLILNKKGVFYLDYRDRISDVSYDQALLNQYAYLVDIAVGSGLNKNVRLKMFCKDGSFKVFDVAEKLTLNEVEAKAIDITKDYNFISGASVIPQLVVYDTNAAGEVSLLDSAEDGKGYASDEERTLHFTLDNIVTGAVRGTTTRLFATRYLLTDDLLTFVVPTDVTEEDKFYIMPSSDYVDSTYLSKARLYDVDEDQRLKVVVCNYDESNLLGVRNQGIITSVSTAVDAEGNEGMKLCVQTSSTAKSEIFLTGDVRVNNWEGIYAEGDVDYYIGADGYRYMDQAKLRKGDVIMYFRAKHTGKYINSKLLFRPNENLKPKELSVLARSEFVNHSSATSVYGEILKKVAGAVVVKVPDASNSITPGWIRTCPIQAATNVVRIDKETGRIQPISVEELNIGENIYVFCQFAHVRMVVAM